MLTPIRLNDEPGLATDEISDVGADLFLPHELEASEVPIPEAGPEATLDLGFVGPQGPAEARARLRSGAHR